jgi:hypothetical protein
MIKSTKTPAPETANRRRPRKAETRVAHPAARTKIAAKVANKPAAPEKGKIANVIAMLRRPKGASITDLCKATGWQAHSVRGALSGTIKKKLGFKVTSEKSDGVRVYRIAN